MKYLFECLKSIEKPIRERGLLVAVDYDGTLTPIAATPDEAVLSQEVKSVLEELARVKDCKLAIVSGRALRDIREMVGIKNIVYVGNHGLEIDGPRIHFESLTPPDIKGIFAKIKDGLAKNLANLEGVIIEDKGLTLSVHYRLVPEEKADAVAKIFHKTCRPYHAAKQIRIGPGKKVFEIKPPLEWDKGKAVLWLLAQQTRASGKDRILPVYIGDDRTDEDVFLALRKNGITIFVGRGERSAARPWRGRQTSANSTSSPLAARYYVNDTGEVLRFLRLIRDLKREAAHA